MNSEMQARELLARGMDAEFPVTASRLRNVEFATDHFPAGTQVAIRVLIPLVEQRAELLDALKKCEYALRRYTIKSGSDEDARHRATGIRLAQATIARATESKS